MSLEYKIMLLGSIVTMIGAITAWVKANTEKVIAEAATKLAETKIKQADAAIKLAEARRLEAEAEFIDNVGGDVGNAIDTWGQLIMTIDDATRALEADRKSEALKALGEGRTLAAKNSKPPSGGNRGPTSGE